MTSAALHELLGIAGLSAQRIEITGADPVLPTPFRIGAAGAATIAASGLAAAELWQARTGRSQQVA
ncbi:MAG TPA: acyl-CoA hydratase, partial [Stellaceae bacterium]|nr:acyl-CoA hydratase [Stellaceae bacterium]